MIKLIYQHLTTQKYEKNIKINVPSQFVNSILLKFNGINTIKFEKILLYNENNFLIDSEKSESNSYYELSDNFFIIDRNNCLEFLVNDEINQIKIEVKKK